MMAPLQARRILAFLLVTVPFVPQWGRFDYSSSLFLDREGVPLTAVNALTQHTVLVGFITPAIMLVITVGVVLIGWTRKRGRLSWGALADLALVAVVVALATAWLLVLSEYSAGTKVYIYVSAVRYTDLFVGFWLVPGALLAALVVRWFPWPLNRREAPAHTSPLADADTDSFELGHQLVAWADYGARWLAGKPG